MGIAVEPPQSTEGIIRRRYGHEARAGAIKGYGGLVAGETLS
jgi:hypothetical protein